MSLAPRGYGFLIEDWLPIRHYEVATSFGTGDWYHHDPAQREAVYALCRRARNPIDIHPPLSSPRLLDTPTHPPRRVRPSPSSSSTRPFLLASSEDGGIFGVKRNPAFVAPSPDPPPPPRRTYWVPRRPLIPPPRRRHRRRPPVFRPSLDIIFEVDEE